MTNPIVTDRSEWNALLKKLNASKLVVLTDENTSKYCLPYFKANYLHELPFIHVEIAQGELHKTMAEVEKLWEQWMHEQVDRQALIICLGGGMVSDAGGFAAGTFKRGIRCIHVPTTNLAMCDAALGGKTAINFNGIKNQIGLLHQPEAVLIDPTFLQTLPERELISGFAETLKHALIADHPFWLTLKNCDVLQASSNLSILLKSAQIKLSIAEQDIDDRGIRQQLNFGHTVGHAIESMSLESVHPLLHGEAIALGMLAEAWISTNVCGLPAEDLDEICATLARIYAKTDFKLDLDNNNLMLLMKQDKKNTEARITCTLLTNIGQPEIAHQVDEHLLREGIQFAMDHFAA